MPWQICRIRAVRAEFDSLQKSVTRVINDRRNDKSSRAFDSLDPEIQSLERVKVLMRVHVPSSLLTHRGIYTSFRITQLQPVTDPSVRGVVKIVDHVMTPYILSPASEQMLKPNLKISRSLQLSKCHQGCRSERYPE
jgi:hypothetical protein